MGVFPCGTRNALSAPTRKKRMHAPDSSVTPAMPSSAALVALAMSPARTGRKKGTEGRHARRVACTLCGANAAQKLAWGASVHAQAGLL